MKTCTGCSQEKPLERYGKHRGSRDGLAWECKDCDNARRKEHNKLAKLADHEGFNRRSRAATQRWRYRLSQEEYDRLRAIERCEVCDRTAVEVGFKGASGESLHIDHDHLTGKVRGVLCKACNSALGYLQDDPVRMQRLIEYLKERS